MADLMPEESNQPANRIALFSDILRQAVASNEAPDHCFNRLRAIDGDETANAVATSLRLQTKAVAKLGPGTWWCTERSLAQATPREVADLKAAWMGGHPVCDLCCGIGGDAVAFASRPGGTLVAVDRDPMIASFAAANLGSNVSPSDARWSVHCEDVTRHARSKEAFLHIDPDRRVGENRKTRPEDYSPPWPVVQTLVDNSAGAWIKLAPTASLEPVDDSHRLWISLRGSVREQSLLVGDAVRCVANATDRSFAADDRSAIAVRDSQRFSMFTAKPSGTIESAERPMGFMIEPDAAIRAAELTEAFAQRYRLHAIGGPSGFLTGESAVDKTDAERLLAISEAVIWSGSPDDRKLRKALRSFNAYPWRVKTRGVAHNPNELERRYRKCGDHPVTLWIGKNQKRYIAVITRAEESPIAPKS